MPVRRRILESGTEIAPTVECQNVLTVGQKRLGFDDETVLAQSNARHGQRDHTNWARFEQDGLQQVAFSFTLRETEVESQLRSKHMFLFR